MARRPPSFDPREAFESRFYRLDENHQPIKCSLLDFALNFDDDRQVRYTEVGCLSISTVFLGINHNFFDDGPPILFKTMIFGDDYDGHQIRCASWDEALLEHAESVDIAVNWVKKAAADVATGLAHP